MKPNKDLITIHDNLDKIQELLSELVLEPRINAIKWSQLTKQTPNIKIGYPGQHLASLITGMPGERTGARGNDLIDGSEVKSCSRIDQLDICKDCGSPVARLEIQCSECDSPNILRKNDSKWLFSIRNENDLNVLIHEVNRILLVIGDYPNFEDNDFETLRFRAFEIWPSHNRHKKFCEIMTNYYHKIYLAHKKKNSAKTPAPKNFWPYQFQFYLCNPIMIFDCEILEANSAPRISIKSYVAPGEDREALQSVIMPPAIANSEELERIFKKANDAELRKMLKSDYSDVSIKKLRALPFKLKKDALNGIDEALRSYIGLRDTDRIAISKTQYSRRRRS